MLREERASLGLEEAALVGGPILKELCRVKYGSFVGAELD